MCAFHGKGNKYFLSLKKKKSILAFVYWVGLFFLLFYFSSFSPSACFISSGFEFLNIKSTFSPSGEMLFSLSCQCVSLKSQLRRPLDLLLHYKDSYMEQFKP